jgi:glucose/arabinose dehydrogenase
MVPRASSRSRLEQANLKTHRGAARVFGRLAAVAAVAAMTAVPSSGIQSTPAPGQGTAAPAVAPLDDLHVPTGFTITVFASDLAGARMMAVSPEGTLLVARRGDVVALPDADRDGRAEPQVVLSNLTNAHTLAFREGYLYVGTTPAVVRVRWSHGKPDGPPENFVELPSSTPAMHVSRSILFGRDGRLYVAIGSSCNVCVEGDPRRTTIQVFDADGRNGHTFAAGLRNAVGLDWDPATGRLWATDTGQEQLGDDTPPEEINLVEEGRHYGFPFFYGRTVESHADELKDAARTRQAAQVVAPALEFPAHSTPLGLTFYRGKTFPAEYRTMFVTLHGSSARTEKNGYKVVRVRMQDGQPIGSDDFATGWLKDGVVSGRPRGIITGPDDALYLSDDNKGFIYRIAYAP